MMKYIKLSEQFYITNMSTHWFTDSGIYDCVTERQLLQRADMSDI